MQMNNAMHNLSLWQWDKYAVHPVTERDATKRDAAGAEFNVYASYWCVASASRLHHVSPHTPRRPSGRALGALPWTESRQSIGFRMHQYDRPQIHGSFQAATNEGDVATAHHKAQ